MLRLCSPIVLALAVVALAVPDRSFAQAPTFNALMTTPKGGEPWFKPGSAAVGDFNGDGRLDALVTDNSYNGVVRMLLGNGNGTFAQTDVNVSATPTNPTPGMIKAADLNGDGRLDAVFVSPQGNLAPAVMLNTGNNGSGVPQFTVTHYTPVYSGLRSVTVGDLNGDARPDFIVGNAYGSLYVYLNSGNGTFTAGQATNLMPNVGGSTGAGVIADLNGDGNADYLVTSNQASATDIFFGNGDGTLQTPPAVYPSNGLFPAVADLNEDGDLDFATVDSGNGNLMVYLNNGNGTFSGPALIATGLVNPSSLAIVDISGDGNVDAVIGDFGSGSGVNGVGVFLGDGAGGFGSANLYTVNQRPLDVSVRDFNGDGKLDIATVGYQDNTYGVLLNNSVVAVTTVFASGTATVTTWDPIFPSAAYPYWPSQCSAAPSVGPDANWVNPHAAFAFPLGSHPWEGIAPFNFAAKWINAWSDMGSRGPSGQSWTKYSTPVTGEGDFVVQFLADNCSWIYLDDQLIGVQDDNWSTNGTGRYPLTLTGTGPHTLSFIIWDGGGLAGGKFRLETRQSFIDGGGDPGDLTPPKAPSTTTVSFGVGPFVYTGAPFTATESVSPSGQATIAYSGDCTNAGNTCTATATYAGDATHLGSSDTASITIDRAPTTTTVSFSQPSYVYSGSAIVATASAGATIAYSGSCTNVGTCTATATTAGDANYFGSSAEATAEITKAPTTTTVSFSQPSYVYSGSAIVATASTGATIAYSGSCTDAGTCTATATTAGDANYFGSSASTSAAITPASSTTTVTFGAGPFVYTGSAFTATSTVSPSGTATITYSGDCVNGGTTCSATATYAGDLNHFGSSKTASIVITYALCSGSSGGGPTKNSGSTIPVKIQACNAAGGNIGSSSLPVKAISLSPAGSLNDSGKANPGNLFRLTDGSTYMFNLSTKGLSSGSYMLNYTIGNDPTVYQYAFGIK